MPKQCCTNCDYLPCIGVPQQIMEDTGATSAEYLTFGAMFIWNVDLAHIQYEIFGRRGTSKLDAVIVGTHPCGPKGNAPQNFIYSTLDNDPTLDNLHHFWIPDVDSAEETALFDFVTSGGEIIVSVPQLCHFETYSGVVQLATVCQPLIDKLNTFLERLGSNTRFESVMDREYLDYRSVDAPYPVEFLGIDDGFTRDYFDRTKQWIPRRLAAAQDDPGYDVGTHHIPVEFDQHPIEGTELSVANLSHIIDRGKGGSPAVTSSQRYEGWPALFRNPSKATHLGYNFFVRDAWKTAQAYDSDSMSESLLPEMGNRGRYVYTSDDPDDKISRFPIIDKDDRIKTPIGTTERVGSGRVHVFGITFTSSVSFVRLWWFSQLQHGATSFSLLRNVFQFRNMYCWTTLIQSWYDLLCRTPKVASIPELMYRNDGSYGSDIPDTDPVESVVVRHGNDANVWPLTIHSGSHSNDSNPNTAMEIIWDDTEVTNSGSFQNDVFYFGSSATYQANELTTGASQPTSDIEIAGTGTAIVSWHRTTEIPVTISHDEPSDKWTVSLSTGIVPSHMLAEVHPRNGSASLLSRYNDWRTEFFNLSPATAGGTSEYFQAPFLYYGLGRTDSRYEPRYVTIGGTGRIVGAGNTLFANLALQKQKGDGSWSGAAPDWILSGEQSVKIWQDGEWFYPTNKGQHLQYESTDTSDAEGYRSYPAARVFALNSFEDASGNKLDLSFDEDNFMVICPRLIVRASQLEPNTTYRPYVTTGMLSNSGLPTVDLAAATPRHDFAAETADFLLPFETTDTIGGLELVKTAELRTTWADGNYIDYEFQITNVSGEELVAAELIDDTALGTGTGSSGGSWDEFDMEVDEVVTLTGEYQLTSDDITAGFVTNQAEVEASGPSGTYRAEDTVTISP